MAQHPSPVRPAYLHLLRPPRETVAEFYANVTPAPTTPEIRAERRLERELRRAQTTAQVDQLDQFQTFLHLVSIDITANRWRWYTLIWQPTLWDEWALVVQWGRIGAVGSYRSTIFQNRAEATPAIRQTIRARLQHGYTVRSSS